jgi:hypothetical protein
MNWRRRSKTLPLAAVLLALLAAFGVATSVAAKLDPARLESWKLPEASLYGVTARGSLAWAAGYWGTILRSTDGGRNWTQPDTPTAQTCLISFADDKTGWAVGARERSCVDGRGRPRRTAGSSRTRWADRLTEPVRCSRDLADSISTISDLAVVRTRTARPGSGSCSTRPPTQTRTYLNAC